MVQAQSREIAALTAKLEALAGSAERRGLDSADGDRATARVGDEELTEEQRDYRELVRRIHEVTEAQVPAGATVILLGKAETELLDLKRRKVWRFPQTPDGEYAGYYPACSTSAIVHLEAIRSKGAGYLLIPEISRWWLDHYSDFANHLRRRYPCLLDESGVGLCFSLSPRAPGTDVWQTLDDVLERIRSRGIAEPAILDWNTGLNLALKLPQQPVFSPPSGDATLPYLDASIDIVAVPQGDAHAAREAARVAASAVLTFSKSRAGDLEPAVKVRWKATLERSAPPTASIVIPCFNGMAHTDACLTALGETLPDDFRGEIIVVDDASNADTARRLKAWTRREPRLRVLRNRTNLGFLRSVNKGAEAATGDILIFLNNDTIPVAGWLPPLLRVFTDHADAGAAGGRLVYPSGRLQEAGGVVFRDGSAANFGRDDHNPDLPMYRVFRQVDYCSAALLATPRATFMELGGFDLQYEPGYYEDTDYCFRLRQKGLRVYLQPESVIVHAEGGTAGLDTSVGMKRYQVVNHDKFKQRWQSALERQAVRPDRFDFVEQHALAGRYGINEGRPS
jgi:GT2 family glycosyltransferase